MLADKLFPEVDSDIEKIIAKYPPRQLPEGAIVTRIAPSPTGMMHIGSLYAAMIAERLAHQSGGVFFLRIEDTDKKREVEGATDILAKGLKEYGVKVDEGLVDVGKEVGDYGPYTQSARENIYKTFIKYLLEQGLAYPAFETGEELEAVSKMQTMAKIRPGYYGQWATWRNKSETEALEMIDKAIPWVIRLKSNGDFNQTTRLVDMFRGELVMPQNDQDIVIWKSAGLPTYHFAHLVDDKLMGTTHVIRADEWLPSVTLHLQLFEMMGWEAPVYGHIAPIQKMDGGSRRKLSKRKDPEADVQYYHGEGFPVEAVQSYMLNLANPSFEEWLRQNPKADLGTYQIKLEELQRGSGALFDIVKMLDYSRDFIGGLEVTEMFERALAWSNLYDTALAKLMSENRSYVEQIFNIERNGDKPRKDIAKWSDVRKEIGYFFDELFQTPIDNNLMADVAVEDQKAIASAVISEYDLNDDKDQWLERMRNLGAKLGFASDTKTYKENPDQYKGHFGSVAKVIRVALTGRNQSPDLYEVMKVLGVERVKARMQRI